MIHKKYVEEMIDDYFTFIIPSRGLLKGRELVAGTISKAQLKSFANQIQQDIYLQGFNDGQAKAEQMKKP